MRKSVNNEKISEAYEMLVEKINYISKQFELNFFELWGIIEAVKLDIIRNNFDGKEE